MFDEKAFEICEYIKDALVGFPFPYEVSVEINRDDTPEDRRSFYRVTFSSLKLSSFYILSIEVGYNFERDSCMMFASLVNDIVRSITLTQKFSPSEKISFLSDIISYYSSSEGIFGWYAGTITRRATELVASFKDVL